MAETSLELTHKPVRLRRLALWKGMSPLRRKEALAAYLFLAPFLFFFIIFIAKAVVNSVYLSFFDYNPLKALTTPPPFIGLQNYQELLGDSLWWESIAHTAGFAILTVAGTTLVSLLAALAV